MSTRVRTVRFAGIPDTPSPTPSSTIQSTPYHRTPYGTPYVITPDSGFGAYNPGLPYIPTQINPFLARPNLRWDVRKSPEDILDMISPLKQVEAATNPPLPYLKIQCARLPWTIEIKALLDFVTVREVILGIFQSLRKGVLEAEYKSSILTPAQKNEVRFNFDRRCASTEMPDVEMRKGLKRIDYLGDNAIVAGLRPTRSAETWTIHFSR